MTKTIKATQGGAKRKKTTNKVRSILKRPVQNIPMEKTKPSKVNVINGPPSAQVTFEGKRSCNWFLTWNNYDETSIQTLLAMAGLKRYVIQEEKGEQGTPHLQGVLVFNNQKKWETLRDEAACWWSPAKNIHACRNYCSKVDTRNGKTWIKGFVIRRPVIDPMDKIPKDQWYTWQNELEEEIQSIPDDRIIKWYWSKEGKTGKSCFVKHMCMKHEAILVGGSHKDAYYAIIQAIKLGKDPKIILFDLPRSQGNMISYTGMEGIKNGCFFSPKFESGMCCFNNPHVIVFANQEPDQAKLSKDRWIIKNIDIDRSPGSDEGKDLGWTN